uniref:Gustatory receptor n=1 Tax=Cacopsylla melanoneura TaxID=428564 RepID=A0A8D9B477_9HEMI
MMPPNRKGKHYKLSLLEKCCLTLVSLVQIAFIFYFVHPESALWRKFTAFYLQKFLNNFSATVSMLVYVYHYVPMNNMIEEVTQLDKLFLILSPNLNCRNKLSFTVIRTWKLRIPFYLGLVFYWSVHCAERLSYKGIQVWTVRNVLETISIVFRFCGIKLVSIIEINFVLYAFVDFTLLVRHRLNVLNRLIIARCSKTSQYSSLIHNVIISEHDVSLILLIYTKLQRVQRRLLLCFRISILLFFSINVYCLILVALTAYNQYFSEKFETKHASSCEFLLRSAICYSVILVCVLCTREADQIAINMQRFTSISPNLKFFHMELRDRKFKFEIFRFFSLDFDTFLAMMGFISTYIVIMAQFKTDTIQYPDS